MPHTLEPEESRPKRACSRRPAKVSDENDLSTEMLGDYATQTGVTSTETRFFCYSEIQFLFSDGNVNVESMGEQQRPRGLFQQRSFRLLSASILRPGKARPGPGFLGVASRWLLPGMSRCSGVAVGHSTRQRSGSPAGTSRNPTRGAPPSVTATTTASSSIGVGIPARIPSRWSRSVRPC